MIKEFNAATNRYCVLFFEQKATTFSWICPKDVTSYCNALNPNANAKLSPEKAAQLREATNWAEYSCDWSPEQVFEFFVNHKHPPV